jgi:hypothetical protein
MKLLVAVKSCMRDRARGAHDVIRNTWGAKVQGADVVFFVGSSPLNVFLEDDEDSLPVSDDYDSLPFKTREILRQSVSRGYDFTFLCDNDTFIIPNRLMSTGFEEYDYSGKFNLRTRGSRSQPGRRFHYVDDRGTYPDIYCWCSGGFGYFVSRRAAELVVASEPKVWAEDMYVGQVLGPHIQCGELTAAHLGDLASEISWHYPNHHSQEAYNPSSGWQQEMSERHK